MLQVISGGDRKDRGSAGKSFYYGPEYVGELAKLTVGYNPVDFEEWAEPETRPAFQAALDVLRGLGPNFQVAAFPQATMLLKQFSRPRPSPMRNGSRSIHSPTETGGQPGSGRTGAPFVTVCRHL